MKKSLTRLFQLSGFVFLIVLAQSCITEIFFDEASESLPIISGVISNSPGERTIIVARSNDLDPAIPVSASGAIYQDGQKISDLVQEEIGELRLPMEVQLVPGPRYHFEITTANNEIFQTKPQQMLPLGRTKELTWVRDRDEFGVNFKGEIIEKPSIRIFATVDVNPEEEEHYYRWQVSDVWEWREIPIPIVDTTIIIDSTPIGRTGEYAYDTTKFFVPDTAKSCYPSRDISEYPSTLFRSFGVEAGEARVRIMTREFEESFLFQHYFSAFLHRIDQETYEYYAKNQRLINNDGDIFDEVPAPVDGNVFNVSDPDLRVLGYVEISQADTIRLNVTADDLEPFEILYLCDDEDACEFISPLGRNFVPPDYCICWDCEPFFGEGTTKKPDFWQ